MSARAVNKRVQSFNNTVRSTVFNGHTLYVRSSEYFVSEEAYLDHSTSPSVYLQVVGTAAIKDECGSFGPILTNPIITLPPNVLSTYVPPSYSIGSTYTDPNVHDGPSGFVGHAEALTIADLQCPTFGLGIETGVDGSLHTTVGPPWLPIIIPPPEVFTLDPMWESLCTDLASYYVFESFAIFDPPFALAPDSYLIAPSQAASSPKSKGPPHTPANPTAAYEYDPPATYILDPSDPSSSTTGSTALPVDKSPDPQDPPANAAQPAAVPFDTAAKPTSVPDPPTKSPPKLQVGDSSGPGSRGLGSSIFDAPGRSDPQPTRSGNVDPTDIIPVPESGIEEITVGGQTLSISPSGIYLSGTSYSPGGPAISLSGGVFSLVYTSPANEETTQDEDIEKNYQPFVPRFQAIAGHNVVSNTSGVYVAGSRLSPGGSAITASNTVISLSPAGTLVVGSSSMALSLADTQETSPINLIFAGVTVRAETSAAVIDGITLAPGGLGTEIHGNSMSLEQGGTLHVGTSLLVLPHALETTASAFNLDGVTIQLESFSVLVDGTSLTPGGPGVSIDGHRVSLGRDKTLDVGTNHIALPTAAQETPSVGFDLNGITVQDGQPVVVVDGVTLTSGGPVTIISGSTVSLKSGGALDIGAGTATGRVSGTSILQTFEGAQKKAHRIPNSLVFSAIIISGTWMNLFL